MPGEFTSYHTCGTKHHPQILNIFLLYRLNRRPPQYHLLQSLHMIISSNVFVLRRRKYSAWLLLLCLSTSSLIKLQQLTRMWLCCKDPIIFLMLHAFLMVQYFCFFRAFGYLSGVAREMSVFLHGLPRVLIWCVNWTDCGSNYIISWQ